jgi:hypothetical protein
VLLYWITLFRMNETEGSPFLYKKIGSRVSTALMKPTKAIPKSHFHVDHFHAQKFVYMDADFLVNDRTIFLT